VLIAGLVVAGALVGAALLDLGDPEEAARARAASAARLAGAALATEWREVASVEAPPPGALGSPVRLGAADALGAAPPAPAEARDPRTFEALLGAALAAEARGARDDAITFAHEALALGAADARRRPEAHLVLARVWSALGEPVSAAPHRAAAAEAPPGLTAGGVPVALLAHLVAPVDGAGALDALRSGAADVLFGRAPGMTAGADGLALDEPPIVGAIRAKLADALDAEGLDADALDAALGVEARLAAAISRALDASGAALEDARWTVHRLDGATVAARGGGDARAVALDEAALHDALRARALADLGREGDAGLWVRVAERGAVDASEALFGPAEVPGLDAVVASGHAAPTASAAPELRRLRIVRGALLLLAALTAGAAGLTVRTLRSERRLAAQRETFVASVSHDLRTPVQALLLLAEALDEGRARSDESRAEYTHRIRVEAERLRRLVDDVLDASRIGRGMRPRLAPREVETAPFVESLERDLAERAERAGASLSIARGPLPSRLDVDPDAVRRAVWNLFENALRHGRRGDAPARVEVGIAFEAGALTFSVDDEGPGVPAKLRERVFQPFERGASEGIAQDTGTGLGLSIVRAITVAHGGDARAGGNDRGGARFVARFGAVDEGGAA